ncbi:unnamed protein product [Schistocephalus solidus]|uniref:Secernin-2 n=1 Tax=Schistocephalus solidus TaxID=70667 RepID=A0A183SG84_SCHSO|nr:unnamed protein product [Schistocephalus solidus]
MAPHPGEDKLMVGPSIGNQDCLFQQRVLLFSHPDAELSQLVPVLDWGCIQVICFRIGRQKKGVGQDEPVLCAGSQEEQAIFMEATQTMGAQHTPLCSI